MKGRGIAVTPLMAGVRTDCEKLLELFEQKDSCRFAVFKQIFHDLHFSAIYIGRETEIELRQFSEKLLSLAAGYAGEQRGAGLQERVGGVYLLYSLYYLQPQNFRYKICVSPDQLFELYSFMADRLKPEGHLDASFVLFKLFRDQAFKISYATSSQTEYNPLAPRMYDMVLDVEQSDAAVGKSLYSDELRALVDDTVTRQVEVVHEKYMDMKRKVPTAQSLNLVVENPVSMCNSIYAQFQDKMTAKSYQKGIGEGKSPKKSQVKERRASLKQRAYGSVAMQGRHRRHRQHPTPSPEKRQFRDASTALAETNDDILSPESETSISPDKEAKQSQKRPKLRPELPATKTPKVSKKRKTTGKEDEDVVVPSTRGKRPPRVTAPFRKETQKTTAGTSSPSKTEGTSPSKTATEEANEEGMKTGEANEGMKKRKANEKLKKEKGGEGMKKRKADEGMKKRKADEATKEEGGRRMSSRKAAGGNQPSVKKAKGRPTLASGNEIDLAAIDRELAKLSGPRKRPTTVRKNL